MADRKLRAELRCPHLALSAEAPAPIIPLMLPPSAPRSKHHVGCLLYVVLAAVLLWLLYSGAFG